jgi:hypothetical protein
MEAVCSYQITQRHIPVDSNLIMSNTDLNGVNGLLLDCLSETIS